MAQSLTQIYVHLIFSTKDRLPLIPAKIEPELYAYLGSIIKRVSGHPILINGVSDHVHILSTLPKIISLSDFIREIKTNSSRWMKVQLPSNMPFSWQEGYGAFSVSSTRKKAVLDYIADQKNHHKAIGFQEELLQFLKQYEVEYDERYLWN